MAFCCISTGVFHFPNKRAAQIAVSTVDSWLSQHPGAMERVIFNVFKDEDKKYYEELMALRAYLWVKSVAEMPVKPLHC